MAEELRHNVAEHRFELLLDGELAGEAHYRVEGDRACFDHTLVPERFGGRGIAGRLVRYAMDEVRAAGQWRVEPACPYVAAWFTKHPEYADLLA